MGSAPCAKPKVSLNSLGSASRTAPPYAESLVLVGHKAENGLRLWLGEGIEGIGRASTDTVFMGRIFEFTLLRDGMARRDTGRPKCAFIEDPALPKRLGEHEIMVGLG